MKLTQLNPRSHQIIQLALLLSACLCRQAVADSITVAETWADNTTGGIYSGSTDHGTFNASLSVSNLTSLSANDWSNLLVMVNSSSLTTGEDAFGNQGSFSNFMANAPAFGGTVSATNATFYFQLSDTNGNPANAYQMTFSRSGDILTIAGQTLNPAAVQPPWSIAARNYLDFSGSESTFAITGQADCEVVLQDAVTAYPYADILKTIYLIGTNTISYDADSNELNEVVLSGAADYLPPTLTAVSPVGTVTTTNDLLTVQVNANDNIGVANVEFYVNGQDYGSGEPGVSNLWSMNFALLPGLNTIWSQATDVNGNNSPTNILSVTYVNRQTTANLITFSEQWLVASPTNLEGVSLAVDQDVGTLNAAWLVPGLQSFSANTWSNLILSVSFGNVAFSSSLAAANVLTASNALFYVNTIADPNNNPLTDVYLSVARSGNTLVLAYETGNPAYAGSNPILANNYVGTNVVVGRPVWDAQPFALSLQDGITQNIYTNISEMLYIAGTSTAAYDAQGNPYDNVQIFGAATLVPPTLTAVSPTGAWTTTNDLLTLQVKASLGVANVEFYLNGEDYGSGELGVSNLWSMNFALWPGLNTLWTQATDVNGNISTTNTVAVTYVDTQTNANLITFSEQQWSGSPVDIYGNPSGVVQNAGTLNAALLVPGLQSLSASTWSNLVVSLSFGDVAFSSSLGAANVLSSSNAIFYVNTISDPNNNPLTDVELSVARSGNTLVLAYEAGNPAYAENTPIIAGIYSGVNGPIQDQEPFVLSLQDGLTQNSYTNISQALFITGTDTITNDWLGNQVEEIQITGAADYTTPTLTAVSPAGTTVTTSNDLFTVQVSATDSFGIANVEFYVNGLDYGPGLPGVSNLWSQNFALLPGTNLLWTQATDAGGNTSGTNALAVLYVNRQTNANLITYAEHWQDTSQSNSAAGQFVLQQDVGTLNAALLVPGLQSMTANTWTNLVLTVSFGGVDFNSSLAAANVLSSSNAVFDLNPIVQLSVTRSGNTLVLAYETETPFDDGPNAILADGYRGLNGPVRAADLFALVLQDGLTQYIYTNISQTVFITGTDTITFDPLGDELDNVQVAGSADYTTPTLTAVSPTGALTTTNDLLTVQVRAADSFGIGNVEFYLNGADYGSGVSGASNLWSLNFALLPGLNTIQSQATDVNGKPSPTNTLLVTYVNKQTNASAITFSEHWLDSSQSNSTAGLFILSQDVGTLNAALLVPGLKSFSASTWSNLILTVSFGDVLFSNSLAAADVLTASNAVFYVNTIYDPNNNLVTDVYLSLARSGNTLVLAAETGNPTYDQDNPLIADYYLGVGGPILDAQTFALTLQDGTSFNAYANVSQTLYLTGTDGVTYDAQTNELDNVQIAGAATFMPPTLTVVAPAAGAQLTNGLVTVQARAVVNDPAGFGAGNVEFFLNGQDFGPGLPGISNLWTMNFSLAVGSNTVGMVATDFAGNNPATNSLQLVYLNQQTNANLITFEEHWLDSEYGNSQDTGLLDAALTVPGLQSLSANTWSNLSLTLSFGNFSVSQFLTGANVLTTNRAVFYFTNPADSNATPAEVEQLTVSRAGNTLMLAARVGNPTYLAPGGFYFLVDNYLALNGPFQDAQPFALTLQDGTTLLDYANVSKTVFIAGTNTYNSISGNNLQIIGAANFIPPALTAVSPASSGTVTNGLLTVQVRATDNFGVTNVEFYFNGQDFGEGLQGLSNLWTMNFALAVGTNTVATVATDFSGNTSATNTLQLIYVDTQTNANVITFAEQWQDTFEAFWEGPYSIVASQDTGLLNAALTVPGLKTMSANTWSNLSLSLALGNNADFSFQQSLAAANLLTTNKAVFYFPDPSNPGADYEAVSVSRAGNTLILAARTSSLINGSAIYFIADDYLGASGPIHDQQRFSLQMQDGTTAATYAAVNRPIYIQGSNTLSQDLAGDTLNHLQITGAANFTPPTLTSVSPATSGTVTNGLWTVQVRATDNVGVTNVEFYFNGQDFGEGLMGLSNLWTMNFALAVGTNTVVTVATDFSGNTSATNTLQLVYVDTQTNANVITYAEQWQDTFEAYWEGYYPFVASQDTGLLNAALTVPGLKTMSANTWSNLSLSLVLGNNRGFSFQQSLASANVLTTNKAVFYIPDPSHPGADYEAVSVSRAGNTLILAARTSSLINGAFMYFIANNYLGTSGPIQDQQEFSLLVQDGATAATYAAVNCPIYVQGSNSVSQDLAGDTLNHLQVTGAADFIPPTLLAVTPASSATVTNGLWTVQVKAADNFGVTNVEFYFNGQDFGEGLQGLSNLWTMNFALAVGTNTVQTVATDFSGNTSATNTLQLVYVDPQTNANVITYAEQWQDTFEAYWEGYDGFVASQDTGLLNAALTVPGLQTMSANTWSNLSLSLVLGNNGDFSFQQSLAAANVLTTNKAVFYLPDLAYPGADDEEVSISRAGNTLILAARTSSLINGGGIYWEIYFIADNYLGSSGPIQDQQLFSLLVQDGATAATYAAVNRPIFVQGSNTLSQDLAGDTLNHLQVTGVADFIPPTNTITAPIPNQQWSNALFTVTGTARDNLAVSNVLYSLNGGAWTSAVSTNQWTNWTAQVTLTPGLNSLQAYAVDTSGNNSVTNAVSFNEVVSSQLQLRVVGVGAIAPNYSNALLQIGKNYSITSAPASGFKFSGWTVSTNWLGGVLSNNTVLQFTMTPNLTLLATFTETNHPSLTVTAPTGGQKMPNALATLIGTASDLWKVAGVWYQVNSNAWNLVTTTNGYTNWTQTVTLLAGTNTLRTYALNLGGLFSATNTISVVSSNSFKLQLALTNAPLKTGGSSLNLQISLGLNGHILVSSNLLNWSTLTNFVGTNTSLTVRDPSATNSPGRFYRAVIP